MNIFAGTFTLENAREIPELDFDIIAIWNNSYFIMGADESLESSKDVIKFLETKIGKLKFHDISIESEDQLEILTSEYEDGTYEMVQFEGENVSFEDILERFADSAEVVCIREAQESKLHGNRIIKADFLY